MAVVERVFLDTSILLSGLIDFGESSQPSMRIYDAVAAERVRKVCTAWHCCLEFFSVSTRLPMEFRIPPGEALLLLQQEVIPRLKVVQLPGAMLQPFLESLAGGQVRGGRIYDAHIAEIAKSSDARIVVTNNQRHFIQLLKEDIRVLTAVQFAALL